MRRAEPTSNMTSNSDNTSSNVQRCNTLDPKGRKTKPTKNPLLKVPSYSIIGLLKVEKNLQSLRKQLCHWSTSFVFDWQGLCGQPSYSVWYISSGWMLHSIVISLLRRLVWNFLCCGSNDMTNTMAKVTWSTLIFTREADDLRIIDPAKCITKPFFPSSMFKGFSRVMKPWKYPLEDTFTLFYFLSDPVFWDLRGNTWQ